MPRKLNPTERTLLSYFVGASAEYPLGHMLTKEASRMEYRKLLHLHDHLHPADQHLVRAKMKVLKDLMDENDWKRFNRSPVAEDPEFPGLNHH